MDNKLNFMDFCAGIGGGRLGLTNANLNCVAFSEIDDNAEKTYRVLYGNDETNFGDLTTLDIDCGITVNFTIAGDILTSAR